MGDIQRIAMKRGYETLSIVGRRKPFSDMPCIKVGDFFSFGMHVIITTLFDRQGFGSRFETGRIVSILRKEKPDIVHLHNLHGYYLNLPILFQYLTEEFDGKVFWTFHDCWPMTGHCAHFDYIGCDRWKTGCYRCPQHLQSYPYSISDSSRDNYDRKRKAFTGVQNLTIVTPSKWLANIVKQSYLKEYPVRVIPNGIDTDVFRIISGDASDQKSICTDAGHHHMILGVANVWTKRKGTEYFEQLADMTNDSFIICLVGVSEHQKKTLERKNRILHQDLL